ncbi:MAG: hypothetical protein JWO70_3178 [Betaproteobacteria bacterium]|nr:hypothetical protein [Betaproteobacteria bacterium]
MLSPGQVTPGRPVGRAGSDAAVHNDILCRHCGAPLDALTRRSGAGICGSARCRHQTDQEHTIRLKAAIGSAAPAAACAQLPHLREHPPAVVWLQHCEEQVVPVNADDRQQHRAYLESVVADGMIIDRSRLAPSTADDKLQQGARLCGQCRGRCCQHGADWRAFIDLTVLQRWQQEEPGRTLANAVEAYLSMLPTRHVRGACLYQGATGCAMPRERRAEICNGFACETLQQVGGLAENDPARAVLAITFHKDKIERAAVIEDGATHTVTLETPAVSRTGR